MLEILDNSTRAARGQESGEFRACIAALVPTSAMPASIAVRRRLLILFAFLFRAHEVEHVASRSQKQAVLSSFSSPALLPHGCETLFFVAVLLYLYDDALFPVSNHALVCGGGIKISVFHRTGIL